MRLGRLLTALAYNPFATGIGCDEDTAAFIDPDDRLDVMGSGGLTVIANAPNPAGQSILGKHFDEGISALGLLKGSLIPTAIMLICFLVLQ